MYQRAKKSYAQPRPRVLVETRYQLEASHVDLTGTRSHGYR
jgi:hypothetical protein